MKYIVIIRKFEAGAEKARSVYATNSLLGAVAEVRCRISEGKYKDYEDIWVAEKAGNPYISLRDIRNGGREV